MEIGQFHHDTLMQFFCFMRWTTDGRRLSGPDEALGGLGALAYDDDPKSTLRLEESDDE